MVSITLSRETRGALVRLDVPAAAIRVLAE